MYAGSGRAGDFAGDPLLLASEYVKWLNSGKTSIRAAFSAANGTPSFKWITYKGNTVEARDVTSPQDFSVSPAGVIPSLTAVIVSADSFDNTYDPLGGSAVANLLTLVEKVLIPSDLIGVEVEATKEQLWALSYLFAVDWNEGVQIEQRFNTDIVSTIDDTEQRWGLVETPYRTVKATILVRGKENIRAARNLFARAGKARWLVPLYSDQAILTAAPSGVTVPCGCANRRFQAGARIALVKFSEGRRSVSQIQVVTIDGASSSAVTLSSSANAGFVAGDYIFPLIEAELLLDSAMEVISDGVMRIQIEAVETIGNTALYPLEETKAFPSGVSQFLGKLVLDPIFDFSDSMQVGTSRSGEYTQIGRGKSLQVYGNRARWTYKLNYTKATREGAMLLSRFFEAVGGRLESFYVVSPVIDLPATSLNDDNLVVPYNGPEIDWDLYTHLAILLTDGSITLKAITGVQRVGSNDIVNFSSLGTPPALTEVQRISFAHLARFDSDTFVENWITDEIMKTDLQIIEVFNEAEIEIEDLADFADCEVTPPVVTPPTPITAVEGTRKHRRQNRTPYVDGAVVSEIIADLGNNYGAGDTLFNRIGKMGAGYPSVPNAQLARQIIPFTFPDPITAFSNVSIKFDVAVKSVRLEPFTLNIYAVDSLTDFDNKDNLLCQIDDSELGCGLLGDPKSVGTVNKVCQYPTALNPYAGQSTFYLLIATNEEINVLGRLSGDDPGTNSSSGIIGHDTTPGDDGGIVFGSAELTLDDQ